MATLPAMPELLLGTRTRVRILQHILSNDQRFTRHALAKEIGGGIGPVYEQVDRFIALGVVKETADRKIIPDQSFPFLDSLTQLVVGGPYYFDNLEVTLGRIDALFGSRYYITGYLAACQNGFPMDHEQNTLTIALLDMDPSSAGPSGLRHRKHRNEKTSSQYVHIQRYLDTLDDSTSLKINYFHIGSIAKDIKRLQIYGSNIWIASFERGVVDCLKQNECPYYPATLLILQNINSIDWDVLTNIIGSDTRPIFGTLVHSMKQLDYNVPEHILGILPDGANREVQKSVRDAHTTIQGW